MMTLLKDEPAAQRNNHTSRMQHRLDQLDGCCRKVEWEAKSMRQSKTFEQGTEAQSLPITSHRRHTPGPVQSVYDVRQLWRVRSRRCVQLLDDILQSVWTLPMAEDANGDNSGS